MPRTALIDYMTRHYGPQHLVLAAAGKVEHERLVELADRLFRELPAPAPHQAEGGRYVGGERREERALEEAHLLLGLPAFSYIDDDFYALQVLSTMLGGGMSSRLFQEVRENRGLAYSVFSFASCYHDTGLLGIYAGTGEKETAELVPVVCDELLKLIDRPVEEELARARAQLKTSLMMALESCFAQSEELCAPAPDLRPAHPPGRDHRQGRCRRRGRDPPGRPPPAERRPDPYRARPACPPARPRLDPPSVACTVMERQPTTGRCAARARRRRCLWASVARSAAAERVRSDGVGDGRGVVVEPSPARVQGTSKLYRPHDVAAHGSRAACLSSAALPRWFGRGWEA